MTSGDAFRLWSRARNRAFSVLLGRSFEAFGPHSTLVPPLRLGGEWRIHVGDGVYLGAGSWLQTLEWDGGSGRIRLGSGTSIMGGLVLSAAREVVVGPDVLIARNVYIADHGHAFEDPSQPVLGQGLRDVRPVSVGGGAWLGQNVVVLPGVTIGEGAVVGANSVVRDDVPAWSLAVGAPARVVRSWSAREAPGAREGGGQRGSQGQL